MKLYVWDYDSFEYPIISIAKTEKKARKKAKRLMKEHGTFKKQAFKHLKSAPEVIRKLPASFWGDDFIALDLLRDSSLRPSSLLDVPRLEESTRDVED